MFDYLTRMVKLSEKKSRHIVHQLLLAVCHMHRHDVVHRDLKVRWAGLTLPPHDPIHPSPPPLPLA